MLEEREAKRDKTGKTLVNVNTYVGQGSILEEIGRREQYSNGEPGDKRGS